MGLPVWVTALLAITTFLVINKVQAGVNYDVKINPVLLYKDRGNVAQFTCTFNGADAEVLDWWFVKENTQISQGSILLHDVRTKYAISKVRNAVTLQITGVEASDAGDYKCQLQDDSSSVATANLQVRGTIRPVIPTEVTPANVTKCCDSVNISATCRPACDPANLDMLNFDPATRCGTHPQDLVKLLKCGSDGRNHASCCKRRMLPDICLPYCMGEIPTVVDLSHSQCLRQAQDIVLCFSEGHGILPSQPESLTAVAYPNNQIMVTWLKPEKNSDGLTGYRVYYKTNGMVAFKFTNITENRSYLLKNLHSGTSYIVYVIAINSHGSSQPSYNVTVSTYKGTPTSGTGKDFQKCCADRHVTENCQKYVCGGSLEEPSTEQILGCFPDIEDIFTCMSGERNHSACCQRRELPTHCLPVCAGDFYAVNRWSAIDCFRHMPDIRSCYLESTRDIPGPPTSVKVSRVTSRRAILSWGKSRDQALVKEYKIRYFTMRAGVPGSPVMTSVKETSSSFFMMRLQPNTLYKVGIQSIGLKGTSAWSPEISFLTYSDPENIPLPQPTIFPPTSPPPHVVSDCCTRARVPSRCMSICSYEANVTTFLDLDLSSFAGCETHLGKILQCGADGRNHTQCCMQRSVEPLCQPFCAFNSEHASNFTFGNQHYRCLYQAEKIVQCMKQGLSTLPSAPQVFHVKVVTTNSASLEWRASYRNAEAVVTYQFLYWKSQDGTMTSAKMESNTGGLADVKDYILQNLKDDTEYTVKARAVSKQGSSVYTSTVRFRTQMIPTLRPKFNGTFPTNLTGCCRAAGVSPGCVPACGGNVPLDSWNCSADFAKMVKCGADNVGDTRDHTNCCKRRNVPASCLGYCSGAPAAKTYADLVCLIFTEQILSCFKEGYAKLPTKPLDFRMMHIGPQFVQIAWDPPRQNSIGVTYSVFYKRSNTMSRYTVTRNVTSPYTINRLEPGTHYDIFVIAENQFGSSQSSEVFIVWTARESEPSMQIRQDPPGLLKVNGRVILRCIVEGNPRPDVYWIRNSRKVNSNMYTIPVIKETDVGRYTCIANNTRARSHHDTFLHIMHKPQVQVERTEITAYPYTGNATMVCSYDGYPTRMRWFKGSVELPRDPTRPGRFQKFTGMHLDSGKRVSVLNITMLTNDDFGVYTCSGNNELGTVQKHVKLIRAVGVQPTPPPHFTPAPAVTNVSACCIAAGVSKQCMPTCSYDVDLTAIESLPNKYVCALDLPKMIHCAADGKNHTSCCRKKNVDPSCYKLCAGVEADIDLDPSLTTCLARVEDIVGCMEEGHKKIPSKPRSFSVYFENGYINIAWSAPAGGSGLVAHYVIMYTMNSTQQKPIEVNKFNYKYSFGGVHAYTMYNFWMVATNHQGQSQPTTKYRIRTDEMVPSPPQFLQGTMTGSDQVYLVWKLPEINSGAVHNYTIYYRVVSPEFLMEKTYKKKSTEVFHFTIQKLLQGATYSIYVTAVSSHHESKPSNVVTFKMPGKPVQSAVKGKTNGVAIGLGVFFALVLLVAIVAVAVFLYFKIRKQNTHSRFKDEPPVSFENPGYATAAGDGRISGISTNSDNPEDETNCNPLYATITSRGSTEPNMSQFQPIDSRHVDLTMDKSASNM